MAFLPAPGGTGRKRKLPPWEEALLARSQGLNAKYGLGGTAPPVGSAAPTPPPPPAGPPGSITAPGFEPDYGNLIKGDANVIAGMSDLDVFANQLSEARRAAIRRAVIDTGIVPGTASADLDEATLEAARANRFSTAAELESARTRQSTDLRALLSNRGILASGALTGGESRLQESYERGSSQALAQLLDHIAGVESTTNEKVSEVARRRAQLREEAAQRIQQDPRYRPQGEATAKLDPTSGLYVTEDGRWYDRDGNRVAAPPAPTPPPQVSYDSVPVASRFGGLRTV